MLDFKEHDNIDRDIIKINKDSLMLKIQKCKDFYISSSSAFGFGGIALALFLGGYLTQTFHNVGFIPGETIRAIFIALGIMFALLAVKSTLIWKKFYKDHEPYQIISSLLKSEKKPISSTKNNYKEYFFQSTTKLF
jgi:hypothetical protein